MYDQHSESATAIYHSYHTRVKATTITVYTKAIRKPQVMRDENEKDRWHKALTKKEKAIAMDHPRHGFEMMHATVEDDTHSVKSDN